MSDGEGRPFDRERDLPLFRTPKLEIQGGPRHSPRELLRRIVRRGGRRIEITTQAKETR